MELIQELAEFDSLYETLKKKNLVAEDFADRIFSLKGEALPWFSAQKDIALTIIGLVHGNEVGGLSVINQFLRQIAYGNLQVPFSMAFAIGNVPAALKNERFLEKDLNRLFGQSERSSYEDQRARALEGPLGRSAFVLDLHQTIEHTESPFFIFGADMRSLRLAHLLAPEIPIITYSISERIENGLVATGYAIQEGGVAITLELGQKGFDPKQIQLGQDVAQRLINFVGDGSLQTFDSHAEDFEVFTFHHRYKNEGDTSNLLPGFHNFCSVKQGALLGHSNQGPILAVSDGHLLFPKYNAAKRGSKELCILLKKTSVSTFDRARRDQ